MVLGQQTSKAQYVDRNHSTEVWARFSCPSGVPIPVLHLRDGRVLAIAPFLPGTHVVSDFGVIQKPQGEITVRRTVAGLSVGRHFFFGRDPDGLELRAKLVRRLHFPLGRQVLEPFLPDGAGDDSAPLGAHAPPLPFLYRAGVEQHVVVVLYGRHHILARGQAMRFVRHLERSRA